MDSQWKLDGVGSDESGDGWAQFERKDVEVSSEEDGFGDFGDFGSKEVAENDTPVQEEVTRIDPETASES